MSKSGINVVLHPTGLGEFLKTCNDAGSPVPVLASLDENLFEDIKEKSPSTKWVYRTNAIGPDNGHMYEGTFDDAHLAGHDFVKANVKFWALNPGADAYGIINEQGRGDPFGLQWICSFLMGAMDEGQDQGYRILIGNWSTGMPPLDPVSIEIMIPMMRQAMQYGHWLGLHEYAGTKPMAKDPGCLRYRQLYTLMPVDCRPFLVITEASPDLSGTVINGPAYVADMGPYDLEAMKDAYLIGFCLYKAGAGESNIAPILPDIGKWIVAHPPVTAPSLEEQVKTLQVENALQGARLDGLSNELDEEKTDRAEADAGIAVALTQLNQQIIALTKRVEALEAGGVTPPEPPPAHDVVLGTHSIAQMGDLPKTEANALVMLKARAPGHKFMTGDSVSYYGTVFEGIKYDPNKCLTRLFWDARGVTVKPQPAQFVTWMEAGINDAWARGIRVFEFLNEPNVYDPRRSIDWRLEWGGAAGFVEWGKQVIALMRNEWRDIKIVTPGLAPVGDIPGVAQNTDTWIAAFKAGGFFDACEYTGAHVYWRNRALMLTSEDGLNFHRYLTSTSKPLWLTEVANNIGGASGDPDLDKGRQYLDYAAYLSKNEPRIERVYVYILSSNYAEDTDRRMTLVRGTTITDIVKGMIS
jgi:hypothetical protein